MPYVSKREKIEPLRPDRRGAFLLLFLVSMVVGAGNTMLVGVVMPPLTRELEMPDWTAGAIFSLSAFFWVVVSPFWGEKSTEWGRKPVIVLGLCGYGLSMSFFGIVGSFALAGAITSWVVIFVLLAMSRALFGLIGSGSPPASQAYVADRTTKEERTEELAFLTSGFSIGTIAGPAMAGIFMAIFGLISPPLFTAAFAFSLAFAIFFYLPEETKPAAPKKIKGKTKGLWRKSAIQPFLIYAIGLSLITGIITQVFSFAMMDRFELTTEEAPSYTGPGFMLGAVGALISQMVLIRRFKLSPKELMLSGGGLLGLSIIMLLVAQSYILFIMSQLVAGIAQGLARPGFSSGSSLVVTPEEQGGVAGLITACNGMGFVVSPIFGLYAYGAVSVHAPFLISLVILALIMAVAVLVPNVEMDEPPTDEIEKYGS